MTGDLSSFCCERKPYSFFLMFIAQAFVTIVVTSSGALEHEIMSQTSENSQAGEIKRFFNFACYQGWIKDNHPSALKWLGCPPLHLHNFLNFYGSAVKTCSLLTPGKYFPSLAPPQSSTSLQPNLVSHSANPLTTTTLATSPCWYSALEFIR